MSTILIARHGPVALPAPRFPSRDEFDAYVRAYETAALTQAPPPPDLARRIQSASTLFASASPRSLLSASRLAPARIPIVDSLFGEEPQIIPQIGGRWPLICWFSLARGMETFHPREAARRDALRRRAEAAAQILIDAAQQGSAQENSAALIGHGWFNRAITRALHQSNWRRLDISAGSGALGRVSAVSGYAVFAPGGAKFGD